MSAVPGIPAAGGPRRERGPGNLPGSGWVPASPPAGFPVYGVDASWPAARWLESFGDRIGDPPRWVSLAHQSLHAESLVMVRTYARPCTDALAERLGESPLQGAACDAAHVLVNVTLPVRSLPRPDGLLQALAGHARKASEQFARWPLTGWQVDGATVTARVWWFAGGWAAVSDPVDDVYLTAAGLGPGPDGLSLARLQDGTAYHFDLRQPLYPGVLSASARAAGLRPEPPRWQRRDWHADQLRLLPEPGPGSAG